MSTFNSDFLTLTLEIDKHIDGYIDAYIGPDALKTAVSQTPKRPPADLLPLAHDLNGRIPTTDPARHAYLTAVLRAITTTLRLLNQEEIPYRQQVNLLYDITPTLTDEAVFHAAHNEMDTLLPGSGPLAQRLEAHRQRYYLPNDKVLSLLELARDEARRRTLALLELPGDNGVHITLTGGQPWSAYNWYQGDGRSHIEFNTDTPISALGLIGTFAHEGYPGHHTEALLKEHRFAEQLGYAEMQVALLHSPAAVIAEGIATTAVEIIFPNGSHHDWTVNVLLPAAGITTDDTPATLRRLAKAANTLRHVSGNAAILLHSGKLTEAEATDYVQTYALATPERAAKTLSFITHPLFRPYVFTYTSGYDLLAAAAGDDKLQIFSRCLHEQILPSQLAALANSN